MIDETATHAFPYAPPDDRPVVVDQDPKTRRWRVKREDAAYTDTGGKIVAQDLSSREVADEYADRERTLVPRTDRTRRSATRSTYYGFRIREGLFD